MRVLSVLLLLVVPPTAAALLPPDDAEPPLVASLRLGQRVFWDGPHVERGGARPHEALDPVVCDGETSAFVACAVVTFPPAFVVGPTLCGDARWCVEVAIDVLEGGGALRVALDTPSAEDKFDLWVARPGASRGDEYGCPCYSMEARVEDAEPGRYLVQATFYDVVRADFRMRAYLEPPREARGEAKPLLPNLRMVPPFDFALMDCQATERLDFGAQRCLRFAAGPANVGDGPLDLRVRDVGVAGSQTQRIHASDGSFVDVPAGAFEYHAAHGHYHVQAMGGYELWRVVDEATGELELARASPKVGFCMLDVLMADWRSFRQDEQHSGEGACGDTVVGPPGAVADALDRPMFGLTVGWADIYDYWTEGNYVDVAGLDDGLYVLRATADPTGAIHETDDGDNAAYALVRLRGDAFDVLERGYGASPWDPAKELADDTRRPLAHA